MDAGIWGFIGVVIGSGVSIVTAVMVARNTSSERLKEFQRDNLIQLQDRVSKYTVLAIKYRTESRREKPFTEAYFEEFMLSNQNLMILVERIADESLRKTVEGVIYAVTQALDSTATDSEEDVMKLIVKESNKAWEEIGVVLRSNY